jgi:hypothetical protein
MRFMMMVIPERQGLRILAGDRRRRWTDKLRSAENQKLTRFSVPASLHRIPMRFVGIGQAGGDGG